MSSPNPTSFNGSLEIRDEAGRLTQYYVVSDERLRALEAVCEQLRQQAASQREQVGELLRENERLREEARRVSAARDEYRASLLAVLREQAGTREAEIEAELAEAERTGVPSEQVLREIEGLARSGGNDGG
jgi:hypothetical protein